MSQHTCRYCGLPINKTLIGWIHGARKPQTVHVPRPR